VPPPIQTGLLVAVVSAGATFIIDRTIAVSPWKTSRGPTSVHLVVNEGLLLGYFTNLCLFVQLNKRRATQSGCGNGNALANPAPAARARLAILTATLRSDPFPDASCRRRGQTSLSNPSVAVFRVSGFALAAWCAFAHTNSRGGVDASSTAPRA